MRKAKYKKITKFRLRHCILENANKIRRKSKIKLTMIRGRLGPRFYFSQ